MKTETLSAAYGRGYAERTGAPAIPESVRIKHLDDLTDGELAQLYAIGKKSDLKMYRFKNHEDLPRVHKVLSLFEDYGAAVRIVYLETGWEENLRRNADRAAVVSEHVMEDMLGKLVPPQRWEAQCVEWHCV